MNRHWLFSVAKERLGPRVGLAVAAPSAFARVQSKIEFARLVTCLANHTSLSDVLGFGNVSLKLRFMPAVQV
jgi:hypothetical protein